MDTVCDEKDIVLVIDDEEMIEEMIEALVENQPGCAAGTGTWRASAN